MADPPASFSPAATYVELRPDGGGTAIPVTEDFWPSLISGRRKLAGYLVAEARLEGEMRHWEMHPAGEEFLLLLAGETDLLVETATGVQEVALRADRPAVLVPRGHWHRFRTPGQARLLFVTFGEGTLHRPSRTDPAIAGREREDALLTPGGAHKWS